MLTYEESALLMSDMAFRGRIKVGCLKFADYIMLEPQATPAHNTRIKWAQSTVNSPDMAAGQIQPPVVMDSAVQEAGAEITDDALQASVETVVNKLL
jgi:hypothetical protein